MIFSVPKERILHEYYQPFEPGIPRTFCWYQDIDLIKIVMCVGVTYFYYEVPIFELSESIKALLLPKDRVIGIYHGEDDAITN